VTPVWNKAGFVGRMIASVRAQTFTDWELIIMDDGSSDGSLQEVERAAGGDKRIRWYSQANAGVCAARNNGYAHATPGTEYVQFPDSDDMLEPTMLAELVSALDANDKAVMAYAKYQAVGPDDCPIHFPYDRRKVPIGPGVRLQNDTEPITQLESVVTWAPLTEPVCMMRRTVYDASLQWDMHLGQHGEGVLLFTDMALRGQLVFINKPLYLYRQYGVQSTSDAPKLARQERKTTLQLLAWPGDYAAHTRVRRALVFAEGPARGIRGIERGWELIRLGRVSEGLRIAAAGAARWWMAILFPSAFLVRLERECYAYLHAQGIDWKPADVWRLGR
jgi:hypothetical protein